MCILLLRQFRNQFFCLYLKRACTKGVINPIQKEEPVNNLTSLQTHGKNPQQTLGAPHVIFQHSYDSDVNSATGIETSMLSEQWVTDYFGDDYSIAVPILQLFIEEMLPEIDHLETFLREGGAQELRKKVHKINPSFKMVGQASLAAALTELENDCIYNEDMDELKFKIKKIQAHAEKLKPLILKQFNSISKLPQ